ncbi:putative alanine aminotransferase [Erysiphe necator]|uniref:Alanine aminotransferase 1 n=1 Tax=Uncinula necator TaxID=52586 RepID=A0A0B1NZL8_UNCNE|nr:putative alanine aminotransferase [Erysiphe necator]
MTSSLNCLATENINSHDKDVRFNFQGDFDSHPREYRAGLPNNDNFLPFNQNICANVGNPQKLGQKPITFFRQVLSLLQYPHLLENQDVLLNKLGYKLDVLERAKILLKAIGSLGAYTATNGIPQVRKSIAKFLEKRDGHPAEPADIYLSSGASSAMVNLLNVICDKPATGVLVPFPQFPLQTAMVSRLGSKLVPYYISGPRNSETDFEAIKSAYKIAKKTGTDVRAMVIINPGNLTSKCFSVEDIEAIIDLAATERLVIITDEAYQNNIFEDKFYSFKRVLRDLQNLYPNKYDNVELASIHSVSMGMVGEGGQRGGFFELVGFDPAVQFQIYKLLSFTNYCPSIAQCLIELMVNPPQEDSASYELYEKEYCSIFVDLKEKSFALYEVLKQMEGVECSEPQGSMYLFPYFKLPTKLVEAAKKEGRSPCEFYASSLFEATGICVVPSLGFGQEEGTLHFRATPLAFDTDWMSVLQKFHNEFLKKFH